MFNAEDEDGNVYVRLCWPLAAVFHFLNASLKVMHASSKSVVSSCDSKALMFLFFLEGSLLTRILFSEPVLFKDLWTSLKKRTRLSLEFKSWPVYFLIHLLPHARVRENACISLDAYKLQP